MVLRLNFQVMSVARINSKGIIILFINPSLDLKKISIEYIEKKDFIKKCFTECAAEVGCKYPHYFDKNIEQVERFKNFENLHIKIISQINTIIINCLPVDQISASNRELKKKTPSPRRSRKDKLVQENNTSTSSTSSTIPSPSKIVQTLRKTPERIFPPQEVENNTKLLTKSLSNILRKSKTRFLIDIF